MEEIKTDFCIVGGGPAGLTLALLLLRSGARVTVVERSRSFDREYRGEILQPGGLALLDELGVLAGARERGAHEHQRFQLVERGRALLDIDYQRLPPPYNYLLSIPQRHVLEELLSRCARHDGFTYLGGSRITSLLREHGQVRGVTSEGRDGRHAVVAHCVVGADGRYSKTRRLAGIATRRLDVFDYDVLWFKVPAAGREPRDVRIFRAAGSPVLVYRSYPDSIQIGWTLPHRAYPALAAHGVDHVKEEVIRAIPPYAELIAEHVRALTDLTLLDVFAGQAEEWVADGLVLLGDSAHTHSPIGAQGINLAIQDAALLHPVLMASLAAGDASADFLSRFPAERRPSIDRVMRLQVMQSKAMLSHGKFAATVRPRAAKLLAHTPVYRKILTRIAFGDRPVRIATDLFVTD